MEHRLRFRVVKAVRPQSPAINSADVNTPPAKVKCTELNSKGEPCKASVIKGTTLCRMHTPGGAKEMHRLLKEAAARGETSRGRNRSPKSIELLRERLEAHADEVTAELMRIALHAEKAVVVSGSRDEPGHVEMVPDMDARMKAAAMIYDRIHGKPSQSMKLSGDPDAPLAVVPKSGDRAAAIARMLSQQGAVAPHEGRRRGATNGDRSKRKQSM